MDQDNSIGKINIFQQMVMGQLDINMKKNEFGSLSHTIHKN